MKLPCSGIFRWNRFYIPLHKQACTLAWLRFFSPSTYTVMPQRQIWWDVWKNTEKEQYKERKERIHPAIGGETWNKKTSAEVSGEKRTVDVLVCVCACNGLQKVCACEARGHPSLAVCGSVKCHSLTCADTADVSFEAVTLMWHAKIAILFTHRPTPARQCAWRRVCAAAAEFLHFAPQAFRHICEVTGKQKWKNRIERKKNLHCYYNSACCQSRLAMSVNTLCSFSGANRADSYSRLYTEWHWGTLYNCISTHTHTHKQLAAGDDEDVTTDKVVMLTSGPNYICQSHTRAVKTDTMIYWKKEVTQTKDGKMSRETRGPWSCQGLPYGSSIYIFMFVNKHQCASVFICRKTPSLSQQPSKTRARLHLPFITARIKAVETVQEHLSLLLCSWQTRVSWSSVGWMDQQDF